MKILNNLFSMFDPSSSSMLLNWTIMITPSILTMLIISSKKSIILKKIKSNISNEMMQSMKKNQKKNINFTSSWFFFIVILNTYSLIPFSFTLTAQISFCFSLATSIWMSINFKNWKKNTKKSLAHLVPMGSPSMLIPILILIELISLLIRPITLSVRLTANMMAGHLLMSLMGETMKVSNIPISMPIMMMLSLLELAVSFIQAYVFSILVTLYSSEIYEVKFNFQLMMSNSYFNKMKPDFMVYMKHSFCKSKKNKPMKKFHQFHMVNPSPWPMAASMSAFSNTTSLTLMMMIKKPKMILMSLTSILITSFQWWRDTLRESSMEGNHHHKVMKGMKLGMILFIASEVMFFSSFFWAFFHSATTPTPEIGAFWPPKLIKPFNPTGIPLLNTLILISSGASITWSHHSILKMMMNQSKMSLLITINLGAYFTILQGMEYWQAKFNMSDSVYGSTFFMATGFHGIHVLIGSTFLLIMIIQLKKKSNSNNHFIGFDMAAWYWHFVDVVWLFLYSTIYWWGI